MAPAALGDFRLRRNSVLNVESLEERRLPSLASMSVAMPFAAPLLANADDSRAVAPNDSVLLVNQGVTLPGDLTAAQDAQVDIYAVPILSDQAGNPQPVPGRNQPLGASTVTDTASPSSEDITTAAIDTGTYGPNASPQDSAANTAGEPVQVTSAAPADTTTPDPNAPVQDNMTVPADSTSPGQTDPSAQTQASTDGSTAGASADPAPEDSTTIGSTDQSEQPADSGSSTSTDANAPGQDPVILINDGDAMTQVGDIGLADAGSSSQLLGTNIESNGTPALASTTVIGEPDSPGFGSANQSQPVDYHSSPLNDRPAHTGIIPGNNWDACAMKAPHPGAASALDQDPNQRADQTLFFWELELVVAGEKTTPADLTLEQRNSAADQADFKMSQPEPCAAGPEQRIAFIVQHASRCLYHQTIRSVGHTYCFDRDGNIGVTLVSQPTSYESDLAEQDGVELNLQSSGLLTGSASPGNFGAAADDFFRQLAEIGNQLDGSLGEFGMSPMLLTLAMAATAYEASRLRRRTSRRASCLAAGNVLSTLTWFSALPGTLSTEVL